MLKHLKLSHVGPATELTAEFAPRLNLITGDNGLGKSFLLDIAWWAMTRSWPREVNPALTTGEMARPTDPAKASIFHALLARSGLVESRSTFSMPRQSWKLSVGRPAKSGLVIYAMVDGSFAVWDPARNYWRESGREPAYVFAPREVWDGQRKGEVQLCNGLIADWAGWQKENGEAFARLCAVLDRLSSAEGERLVPGNLTKISLEDDRDIPTLKMPYGQEVPVLHVSSGIKRIVALAYLLVWSWQSHVRASAFLGEETATQMVFLIDEVEAHLHPRWQRSVVGAVLEVVRTLAPQVSVQLLVTTHSPLLMASVEPLFDAERDAWFDLDLVGAEVQFRQRDFVRLGEVTRWLMSDAFGLGSGRSLEAERLLQQAALLLSVEAVDPVRALALDAQLRGLLGDTDPFWTRWRFVGERQGWLA